MEAEGRRWFLVFFIFPLLLKRVCFLDLLLFKQEADRSVRQEDGQCLRPEIEGFSYLACELGTVYVRF